MKGLIFAVEEFAVHDGSGIRVNVFFKGCPLRCKWCHNPEGLKNGREIVRNPNGCIHCNICKKVCPSPDKCIGCRRCMIECPQGLIRFSGEEWEADELAEKLGKFSDILAASGGGLTFSGGEVLMQSDFLLELAERTKKFNRIIETCGYGDPDKFREVLKHVDSVYYDLKIMDSEKHEKYTGVPNELILKNAEILFSADVEYTIRVPYIHDINTDEENLRALAQFLRGRKNLKCVELLKYNSMAGAKYKMMGMEFNDFTAPDDDDFKRAASIFTEYGIKYAVYK